MPTHKHKKGVMKVLGIFPFTNHNKNQIQNTTKTSYVDWDMLKPASAIFTSLMDEHDEITT